MLFYSYPILTLLLFLFFFLIQFCFVLLIFLYYPNLFCPVLSCPCLPASESYTKCCDIHTILISFYFSFLSSLSLRCNKTISLELYKHSLFLFLSFYLPVLYCQKEKAKSEKQKAEVHLTYSALYSLVLVFFAATSQPISITRKLNK
jgi:hypothetical protein